MLETIKMVYLRDIYGYSLFQDNWKNTIKLTVSKLLKKSIFVQIKVNNEDSETSIDLLLFRRSGCGCNSHCVSSICTWSWWPWSELQQFFEPLYGELQDMLVFFDIVNVGVVLACTSFMSITPFTYVHLHRPRINCCLKSVHGRWRNWGFSSVTYKRHKMWYGWQFYFCNVNYVCIFILIILSFLNSQWSDEVAAHGHHGDVKQHLHKSVLKKQTWTVTAV